MHLSASTCTTLAVLLAFWQQAACFLCRAVPLTTSSASTSTSSANTAAAAHERVVTSLSVTSATATYDDEVSTKTTEHHQQQAGGYWDEEHDDVPAELLKQIRLERWRGGIEPASDQLLTEIPKNMIEGTIPKELVGTALRMGPGRIRVGDSVMEHWFDGDGYVSKICFTKEGKVFAQGKYVRTPIFNRIEETGNPRPMQRGWTKAAGVLRNIFKKKVNPSNTSVQVNGDGRLFANCEIGLPMEIDKNTLETVGLHDFDGALSADAIYSAHPSVDYVTGEVYNHGTVMSTKAPYCLNIMKISRDGKLVKQNAIPYTDCVSIVHDNVITEEYFIFLAQPYEVATKNLLKYVLGTPIGKLFEWNDKKETVAYFVSKDTLELVAKVPLPSALSSYHFIAAYDVTGVEGSNGHATEEGKVVVDLLKLREGSQREQLEKVFKDLYHEKFDNVILNDVHRFEFDLKAGKCTDVTNFSKDYPNGCKGELSVTDPRYGGRRTRFAFGGCMTRNANSGFMDSIFRLDLDTGKWSIHRHPDGCYNTGPLFVPRGPDASEADGYVLSTRYNSNTHTSDVVIIDTRDFGIEGQPPVATIHLPFHFAFDFHGTWAPNEVYM